jgi:peptidoglycan/LPS O-acetylase OafA/YrhL
MDAALPAMGRMPPGWVDFFIMVGAFALVAIGALIWLFFLRKPGRRRRKHRHRHERRSPNPTLAQNGGLPPIHHEEKPSRRPPPTPQP